MTRLILFLLAVYVPVAEAVEPVSFEIITEESAIEFEAIQNGGKIKGGFPEFTVEIKFHPEALEKSSVRVVVNTANVQAGYEEVPSTLKGEDWFNVSVFPQAVFETKSFKPLGEEKYEADGELSIKGHVEPVKLTFTLHQFSEVSAYITGEATLKRTVFNIGWSDTKALQDEVKVLVKIKAVATT